MISWLSRDKVDGAGFEGAISLVFLLFFSSVPEDPFGVLGLAEPKTSSLDVLAIDMQMA